MNAGSPDGADPAASDDAAIRTSASRINQLIMDLWVAMERDGPRYDEFELTGQQHTVLGLIVTIPEPTARALADALAVTKGAISQHLAVLEREGYISRRRSEHDGRVQLIVLEERARAYRDMLQRFEDYSARRYRGRLTAEDLAEIIAALEKLKGAFTQ